MCAELIHTSLALKFSTGMVKLRDDIRAHLRAELRHVRGPPSPDNAAKVKVLLDVFCGGTDVVSNMKRLAIRSLVKGDPHGTGVVHRCRVCCTGYEDCLAKFEAYFLVAIAGHVSRDWARHRWRGNELAVDDQGF